MNNFERKNTQSITLRARWVWQAGKDIDGKQDIDTTTERTSIATERPSTEMRDQSPRNRQHMSNRTSRLYHTPTPPFPNHPNRHPLPKLRAWNHLVSTDQPE